MLLTDVKMDVTSHKILLQSLLIVKFKSYLKARMTTLMTTKLKKSDDQTSIDKYKIAANITENYIISKLIFLIP